LQILLDAFSAEFADFRDVVEGVPPAVAQRDAEQHSEVARRSANKAR
jgi:hypothetical protein